VINLNTPLLNNLKLVNSYSEWIIYSLSD
jgi:hypothetical protein